MSGPSTPTKSPPGGQAAGLKVGTPLKYGITEPISLAEPLELDRLQSEKMMEELAGELTKETPEGLAHRDAVLKELEELVVEWVVELGTESGLDEEEARRSPARMVTLGSYRLGVAHAASTVDLLCVAPARVSYEAFFRGFLERLQSRPNVSECVAIPDGFVPVIKLKMKGLGINLLFARLGKALEEGQDFEEAAGEDDVLKGMDERSVQCMNGYRVADQILRLVPHQETFRQTLRFVKCWARRRGIYSDALGYFGGITWSLLVARVCQLYPHYVPSQLVNRFFRVYDQWNWSKPVMLCEIVEYHGDTPLAAFKVWNPKASAADRQDVMPVITPAFPATNSTHNVTETTKRILLDEFRRGYEVVKSVEAQRADWQEVHEPVPYFSQFKHFLWLEILATTDEVHQKFKAWVESKLRLLTRQLEGTTGMIIHPSPEQYDLRGYDPEWQVGCSMSIGMAFYKDQGAFSGQTVFLRPALSQFVDVVTQWAAKEAYQGQFLLRVKCIKADQLPPSVLEVEAATRKRLIAVKVEKEQAAKRAHLASGV